MGTRRKDKKSKRTFSFAPFLIAVCAGMTVLLQALTAETARTRTDTFLGDYTVAVWPGSLALALLACLHRVVGFVGAAGVLLAGIAMSFAMNDPLTAHQTVGSAFVALCAIYGIQRFAAKRGWSEVTGVGLSATLGPVVSSAIVSPWAHFPGWADRYPLLLAMSAGVGSIVWIALAIAQSRKVVK